VRATSPSPGAYDVVKIWTTAGPTRRAVASSELLKSAVVAVAAAFVCACAHGAVAAAPAKAIASMNAVRMFPDITISFVLL
jgi:hypothetical protein